MGVPPASGGAVGAGDEGGGEGLELLAGHDGVEVPLLVDPLHLRGGGGRSVGRREHSRWGFGIDGGGCIQMLWGEGKN